MNADLLKIVSIPVQELFNKWVACKMDPPAVLCTAQTRPLHMKMDKIKCDLYGAVMDVDASLKQPDMQFYHHPLEMFVTKKAKERSITFAPVAPLSNFSCKPNASNAWKYDPGVSQVVL